MSEPHPAGRRHKGVGSTTSGRRFWDAVDKLVQRHVDDVGGLTEQGLGPLAADGLERRGSPIPDALQHQQHLARIAVLTAPPVLDRMRAACEGQILLLKGPEVAIRYPQGARVFGDVDVLVPDAERTQRELLAAGFVEEEDLEGIWVGIHHLARLRWPGTTLAIEVHSAPKWLDGLQPPRNEELFEAAVPSQVGVAGVLAPAPSHHALLMAAHAWAHQPLGRARDLVDVGALRIETHAAELERVAQRWGVGRLWHTTTASLDALLAGSRTWPLRLWATHLAQLREQTVLETHLERLLSPMWGYPLTIAARRVGSALANEVRPASDEGWDEKVRRTAAAVRRAFAPITEHQRELGESATRGRRRKTPTEPDP